MLESRERREKAFADGLLEPEIYLSSLFSLKSLLEISKSKEWEEQKLAIQILSEKADKESIKLLRKMLSHPEERPRLLSVMALSIIERKYLKAIKVLKKEMAVDPSAISYQKLGKAYFQFSLLFLESETLANYYLKKAEKQIKKGLKIEPKNIDSLYSFGLILLEQKRFSEAEEIFQKVIKLSPSYSLPHFSLAKIYYQERDYKKVKEECSQYLSIIKKKENPSKDEREIKEMAGFWVTPQGQ